LLTIQYDTVTSPKGDFRVYANGTVTDTKGVFVTTGGVQGLQTYLASITFQTVPTAQGDFTVYQNGTVTDAKGVLITKNGV